MRWTAAFSRSCCATPVLLFGAFCALSASAAPPPPGQVTVYRCTDAKGRVALRDSPCNDGHTQEVRNMLRPVDGAPMARPETPTAPAVDAPPPQVIVLRPPQPMYRCVRDDNTSYTSDSSEGNPRWVPLWTLGYGSPRRMRGARAQVEAGNGGGSVGIDSGIRRPGPVRGGYYGAGTWVRDACHPMPQEEVCGIIADRRSEIRQRFFNAQPTERAQLTTEERAINARLAQDCSR